MIQETSQVKLIDKLEKRMIALPNSQQQINSFVLDINPKL